MRHDDDLTGEVTRIDRTIEQLLERRATKRSSQLLVTLRHRRAKILQKLTHQSAAEIMQEVEE
jgi:chorismate mutase